MLTFQFISTVRLGIKSLMLHKLRSGLTMLGIVFGVFSVIAMLAIGRKRADIDLTHVVACNAGTQPNAWEKMTKALDKENRRLLVQGLPALPARRPGPAGP